MCSRSFLFGSNPWVLFRKRESRWVDTWKRRVFAFELALKLLSAFGSATEGEKSDV